MSVLLTELIAKLEAATGPSRELDASIWELVTGLVSQRTVPAYTAGRETTRRISGGLPAYTDSIDTALTLAEGAVDLNAVDIEVAKRYVMGKPYGRCEICGPHVGQYVRAASPALALCIAALRARAASGDA